MIRLVAKDQAVSLDEVQVRRIRSVLLEFIPARGCEIRRDPPIEITVTDHEASGLHTPLLQRVEAIAGCRFEVTVGAG